MLPDIKGLETQLKQILYGCVEHVQATKAALYLSSSLDLNDKRFELVTSYQYNVADRKTVDAKDDLVDSLAVKRNAFFVNGLGGDQRFAEMQFRQGTDRLLAAPLFARGRLLGFIDMRDKAGKKPFENNDLEAARKIAEEVISLLSSKRMFGLAPIQLVETTPVPNAPPPQPVAPTRAASVLSPAALRAIESAHEYISRRQYLQTARRLVTQGDLEVIHLLLPAALAFRTATLTAFTAVGPAFTTQAIAARGPVTNDAVNRLNEHLLVWLQRKNIKVPSGRSLPMFVYPFGTQGSPVGAPSLDSMLTATVNAPSIEGLLLTVAFDVPPDVDTQHALESYLRQVEESVESAIGASAGRGERQAIAEKLLEPDFQKLPDLAVHAREVANVAQRFARYLELPAHQIETIRIAALVHDVGMRLIDYDRLYRKEELTAEEKRAVAEHPVVGAALVEPLLGAEVAYAVLRHHERFDGKGYPSKIGGQQIPLAARIIQIADTWTTMTSSHTYKKEPAREEEAIEQLRDAAGTQLDSTLTIKFIAALPQIVNR